MEEIVKKLIKEAFKTGYTYSDYRVLVDQLVLENKSTGVCLLYTSPSPRD